MFFLAKTRATMHRLAAGHLTSPLLWASPCSQAERVESQLKLIVRPMYSSPPIHGAMLVNEVLSEFNCPQVLCPYCAALLWWPIPHLLAARSSSYLAARRR